MAGKVYAILQRDYTKGSDIYDLWCYLNQPEWSGPNLAYLNQCIQQDGGMNDLLLLDNWQRFLREKLLPLNWLLVMEDFGSFIIDSHEQSDFTKENLLAPLN